MAASSHKYAQHDVSEGTKDNPMEVCAQAARQCVRNIASYPVLSTEWVALVDSLKQLMRLVQLEVKLPANSSVSEAHGRNRDSEGTLWDQEQNETAIRILVEEAKVNLCLRIMNDYKKWCYDPQLKSATMKEAVEASVIEAGEVETKLTHFEDSLGFLLRKAFLHVETMQLMNIPLLIEHCGMVLSQRTPSPVAKMQETVVLYYFASMMKHSESLNSELLAKTRELGLVHLVVGAALQNLEVYPLDVHFAIIEGFSAMADNEDFRSGWEDFFQGEDGKLDLEALANFIELEAKVLGPILKECPEKKRDLRPLLDFLATLQRCKSR